MSSQEKDTVHTTTVRLDSAVHSALLLAKDALSLTMNQTVNLAVAQYSQQVLKKQSAEITDRLEALQSYWDADAGFDQAISEIVDGEVSHPDPAEGKVVRSPEEPPYTDPGLMHLLNG